MTGQRTAPLPHVTERRKARVRLLLLVLIALIGSPLSGVDSVAVWVFYALFALLYSVWSLHMVRAFSGDRRLGYLLCLTDIAILLPLAVWSSAAAMQMILVLVCVAGLAATIAADRAQMRHAPDATRSRPGTERRSTRRAEMDYPETALERAVRLRLNVFTTTGARFGLVVLRILRFEEMTAYYGGESSDRLLAAACRRGIRSLGPDAQHFPLPGGRVAFLFETEPRDPSRETGKDDEFRWSDPYDVESVAMNLGRKVCEHLIDGHRVECMVGWASAPADGLSADDLMDVAEQGAQSTAAFRRVAGATVPVPERARAAAG